MQFTKSKPIALVVATCIGILLVSQNALAHEDSECSSGVDSGMLDRQIDPGILDRQIDPGILDRQIDPGTLEKQIDHGMLDRQLGHGMMNVQFGHGKMDVQFGLGMMDVQFNHDMMVELGALDLTDEQRTAIFNLHDELRGSLWQAMGQIQDLQSLLRNILIKDSPESGAVGEIYGQVFDQFRQMIESRVDAQNKVEGLLSDYQIEILDQHRNAHLWSNLGE